MSLPSLPTLRLAGLAGALAIGLAACATAEAIDPVGAPVDAPAPTDSSTVAPGPEATGDPKMAACSGSMVRLPAPDLSGLPEATRATARFLLDAAHACDEQLLVTAATESGTRLTFGNASPGEFLTLPEREGQPIYDVLVRLIAGTTFGQGDQEDLYVFPAVTTGNGTDADWATLVDAGLYSEEEVTRLRASGDGYLGWRIGIDAEGNWTFFVSGD